MQDVFRLAGTTRAATVNSARVSSADPEHRITATIYVRRDPAAPPRPDVLADAARPPSERTYLSPAEAARVFSAAAADMDLVHAFADQHGLAVVKSDARRRIVRIEGTVSQMNGAFGIELAHFQHHAGMYRSYTGRLIFPDYHLSSKESP